MHPCKLSMMHLKDSDEQKTATQTAAKCRKNYSLEGYRGRNGTQDQAIALQPHRASLTHSCSATTCTLSK